MRFEPAEGSARTKVVPTHTGFERLGAQAKIARRAYPLGWESVLGLYAGRRDPAMLLVAGLTWLLRTLRRATVRES